MDKETADLMRGIVRRVTLKNVKDDGQMQTASIEVADGLWRDDVEVMQPFGFGSHVPEDGALALVFALGGDQGDVVVLPVGNPSQRMGKMPAGGVGMYTASGDKITLSPGGVIDIGAGASVAIKVGGTVITVTDGLVNIEGAEVHNNGKNIGHNHGHESAPPGVPGPPIPI